MAKKRNVTVDSKRLSSNEDGKFNSNYVRNTSIENEDGSKTNMVSSNKVNGERGRFKSASLTFDENGNISGNFVRGEKGKQILGPRAERKFSRWNKKMNR